jgi:hypothetical protein
MEPGKLKQLLRNASAAEPVFCAVGMAQNAKNAELLVDKRKSGAPLLGELKAAIEGGKTDKLMPGAAFGQAFADETDAKLVVLKLSKAPPSGTAKKLRASLKGTGFSKVTILDETGALLESDADAEETAAPQAAAPDAAALKARLMALVQRMPQVLAGDASRKESLLALARQGQGLIAANDLAGAQDAIARLQAALDAPPGVAAAPQSSAPAAPDLQDALGIWAQRRADALSALKRLEAAIRAMKHPAGDAAIILVKAVAANLTAVPDTKGKVAELRRYLATDAIIDDAELPNGFGIEVKIRAPLTGALDALDRALPA